MYLLLRALFLLLLSPGAPAISNDQVALDENSDSCYNTCTSLKASLGAKIRLEEPLPGRFFTNQQRDLVSACIFTPSTAHDISTGLQIIKTYGCQFAVRSGGHGIPAGWSNSDGGVSIDLGEMNEIKYVGKSSTVSVGTGARWIDVYGALDPFNISVVGGRSGDVGVGGFILGGLLIQRTSLELKADHFGSPGGLSFISRRYGWAIDNVKNFEVVLANGSIANINKESSPDLFWALRGGGNNFGIVTQFDLDAYPQGLAWGGIRFHVMSYKDVSAREARLGVQKNSSLSLQYLVDQTVRLIWQAVCMIGYCVPVDDFFDAFKNSSLSLENDPYAHMILVFVYAADVNLHLGCTLSHYTKDEGGPEAFKNFDDLPRVYTSTRVTTLKDLAAEDAKFNAAGSRHLWMTATFKLNATLISRIYDIFLWEVGQTRSVKRGLVGMNFQPVTLEIIRHFGKNGGNPLGLEDVDEPLMIVSSTLSWSKFEDDDLMHEVGKRILERGAEEAKKMGLYHQYVYHNYASATQDVFGGYGEKNRQRLLAIQKKHDQDQVFSRLQPGGFKL